MSLDEPQEDDQVEVINGIQVAIDSYLEEYINDLVFDYKKEYGQFVFTGYEGNGC
ncbi:hypothetical protein [Niallia sp. Krafla_26]|uniref:hypothetical protein n=1 Tax=Niallia sp. Krafla_26 TaxID=3064703 RepID=UPI003D16FF6C